MSATAVPTYLPLTAVAKSLSVSLRHVEKLVADGALPAVRLGGCVRVPVDALRPEALPPYLPPEPTCPPPPTP